MILEGFASVLKESFGGQALVGRFGGEEFAVFSTFLSEEEMRSGAERLRAAIESAVFDLPESRSIGVTASIGIAYAPQNVLTFAELYQQADAALYASKRTGKNRVTAFGE